MAHEEIPTEWLVVSVQKTWREFAPEDGAMLVTPHEYPAIAPYFYSTRDAALAAARDHVKRIPSLKVLVLRADTLVIAPEVPTIDIQVGP